MVRSQYPGMPEVSAKNSKGDQPIERVDTGINSESVRTEGLEAEASMASRPSPIPGERIHSPPHPVEVAPRGCSTASRRNEVSKIGTARCHPEVCTNLSSCKGRTKLGVVSPPSPVGSDTQSGKSRPPCSSLMRLDQGRGALSQLQWKCYTPPP